MLCKESFPIEIIHIFKDDTQIAFKTYYSCKKVPDSTLTFYSPSMSGKQQVNPGCPKGNLLAQDI
jgi:hypothetical protein